MSVPECELEPERPQPPAPKRLKMVSSSTMPGSASDANTDTLNTEDTLTDTNTVIFASPTRSSTPLCWPALRIPVEIFDMIIAHLSRKDIQNLRLVNHEFDAKLASSYFKVVVVSFRPEFEALYGSLNINPGRKSTQSQLGLVLNRKKSDSKVAASDGHQELANTVGTDISVLSDGYRVFEQFGASCMRKFALALELNEKDLAFPPLKVNQEIVMAPWGLYRWPIMRYQRYHQLEDLERMADETGYMKTAFAFLENVSDIGISCDAGLGWLQGPDTNPHCKRPRPAVFRPLTHGPAEDNDSSATEEEDNASLSLTILKQMALNAGYDSTEWPRVILRLLEDEGRAVKWREYVSAEGKIMHERIPTLQVDSETTKEAIIRHIEELLDGEGTDTNFPNARGLGLTPNNLTPAQAEMLLELKWAHRALMESYRTAVLDNRLSFRNLTQLTIARCPSCHVSIWCDRDFWSSMTSIKTFHLGVIPDWRQISKDSSGSVVHARISPIEATKDVFTLLQGFVGTNKNVEHVSFEWVSGGEFAVGKSQRDRYILPAPVLDDPNRMVDMQPLSRENVVKLSHVSKLSLKNCWFSPHVFYHFAKSLFLDNLTELVLESVSLTGRPCTSPAISIHTNTQKPTHWPWPLCAGGEPGRYFVLHPPGGPNNANPMPPWAGIQHAMANMNAMTDLQMGLNPGLANAAQQQAPVAVNHHLGFEHAPTTSEQDNQWHPWSWPYIFAGLGFLPEFVYEDTGLVSDGDMARYQVIKSSPKPFSSNFTAILQDGKFQDVPRTIRLKSCGYVLVESPHIDNWKIIPDHPVQVDHDSDLASRLRELDSQMLISTEGLLGKILHYLPDDEGRILHNVFGMRFGWDEQYDPVVRRAAIADGVPEPGEARFSGNLSTHPRRSHVSTRSKGKQVARP